MGDIRMEAKIRRRAAEIVDQGWCQGALARDAQGCRLEGSAAVVDHPSAAAWCAQGAYLLASLQITGKIGWCLLFPPPPGGHSWADFNDTPGRTAAEVSAALRLSANTVELDKREETGLGLFWMACPARAQCEMPLCAICGSCAVHCPGHDETL